MTLDNEVQSAQSAVLQCLGELVQFSTRSRIEFRRIKAEIDQHVEAGFFGRRCFALAVALFFGADANSTRRAELARRVKKLHDVF